ncbi:lyase [Nitrosopumilus sp. K4]|uniref:Vgb family protein n=1 Tax=Nitrosopumilus sp. K4 TaxID=2795383 RepID=UPI001BA9662A|nr:lyase [Nitrosopumilus sp. K4]QUC65053.1 lyase [Nitrosopumilus sp. K4]
MKKKGIIVTVFFAVLLLASTVAIAIPGIAPDDESADITITGTPADNFPDEQRPQFCGSSNAKSTPYVQEFSIPTECTSPLAIVADYDGNVWFAQTNTGKVAKFDPKTEIFSEYENPSWPKGGRSMMWGIDFSPDGYVWFTDEAYDSLWRFSPETQKYQRVAYPSEGNSLPQRLQIDGSQIIVNDFTGNKVTFLDPTQTGEDLNYLSLPSPVDNSVTGDFAVDRDDNLWYTNWLFQESGVLVKYDHTGFQKSVANSEEDSLPLFDFIEIFELPDSVLTPNGAVVSPDGRVWLADTSSSHFFSFDPQTEQFTQYVTSDPQLMTYGNFSGVIKTPISRPYWIDVDPVGRLVFNEQTANSIAVMDPTTESLVEYSIPSRNPFWGDCGDATNCGIAQVFDFAIDGQKIWFTEWVENNIGVIDTSKKLPLSVDLESNTLSMKTGESKSVTFTLSPQSQNDVSDVSLIMSDTHDFIDVVTNYPKTFQLDFDGPRPVETTIFVDGSAIPGTYKILLGAQTEHVSISKYLTLKIEP